ncbi:hypothetical protein O7599_00205 [Streptomyces sp. WMMC500]|uniref:hypothetical protein n=1 Tax=Streptomyces sp. WMMC500 TaxID=3015154 RepID=UPI00248C67D5|nr:hypothetical protein [Streptomyces sp. WMMC500]WBB61019.1 hypothetical protein O7599_00205 [Streptomyces sp. WMMC500]
MQRDVLEAGLGQPLVVVAPPPGAALLALQQHLGGEDQREGRAAAVVDDVVVDDQGAAGLEGLAEPAEHLDVALRPFPVGDVGVDRDAVACGAEVGGGEVTVEAGEPVAHAA